MVFHSPLFILFLVTGRGWCILWGVKLVVFGGWLLGGGTGMVPTFEVLLLLDDPGRMMRGPGILSPVFAWIFCFTGFMGSVFAVHRVGAKHRGVAY